MSKKKQPAVAVLSLDEIAGLTTVQAADQCADKYQARTRAFVEMGKLVYHMENRSGIPKGQSIYGLLQKRGMPEGSVHNARMAANFIAAFVATGLVSEARADEIITHRVVNQTGRLLSGKSVITMTAEELAPLLNEGHKAAIGDELDCLDEHGMSIAARKEAEDKRKAEEARIAESNAKAAALTTTAPPAATTETAPAAPAATDTPPPVVVDGTKPQAEASSPSSHENRPISTADVLARLGEIELQSYDLDPEGLAAVRAKLADWMDLIDTTLSQSSTAKKPEQAAA